MKSLVLKFSLLIQPDLTTLGNCFQRIGMKMGTMMKIYPLVLQFFQLWKKTAMRLRLRKIPAIALLRCGSNSPQRCRRLSGMLFGHLWKAKEWLWCRIWQQPGGRWQSC
ncbi:hypothetical protein D3C75_1094310 [compost metagenome]